jgi:putative sporulation protein YtaF
MLIFLSAVAVTFDVFAVGVSYGFNGISFPPKSLFVMNLTAFIITFFATLTGDFVGMILNETMCQIISSLMISGLGVWMIVQSYNEEKNKKLPSVIITSPEEGDIDRSKSIEPFEAFLIGCAVSIDATVVCFGIAAERKALSFIMPILLLCLQLVFAISGVMIGKKLGEKIKINSKKTALVSGAVIIILGFYGLSGIFLPF